MQFLIELVRGLAAHGSYEQVAEILVACDSVLQREAMEDRELVVEIMTLCNKRLAELGR